MPMIFKNIFRKKKGIVTKQGAVHCASWHGFLPDDRTVDRKQMSSLNVRSVRCPLNVSSSLAMNSHPNTIHTVAQMTCSRLFATRPVFVLKPSRRSNTCRRAFTVAYENRIGSLIQNCLLIS